MKFKEFSVYIQLTKAWHRQFQIFIQKNFDFDLLENQLYICNLHCLFKKQCEQCTDETTAAAKTIKSIVHARSLTAYWKPEYLLSVNMNRTIIF